MGFQVLVIYVTMSQKIKISFDGIDEGKFLSNSYKYVIVFHEYRESDYANQLIDYIAFNNWNQYGDYIKIQSDGETSTIDKDDIKLFKSLEEDKVYQNI
jgi:hypothetical protein